MSKKVAINGKNVGLVVSGGNIDMNLISRIIEKGLIQDGRLTRFSVVTYDQPGWLAQLAQRIAQTGANILQISQTRGFGQMTIGETEIELILETTGPEHIEEIYQTLQKENFRIRKEP
jgi:threonine dehydratase